MLRGECIRVPNTDLARHPAPGAEVVIGVTMEPGGSGLSILGTRWAFGSGSNQEVLDSAALADSANLLRVNPGSSHAKELPFGEAEILAKLAALSTVSALA